MTQIQAYSIILSIVTFYITASRSLPVAIPAFRCCLEMFCKDSIFFMIYCSNHLLFILRWRNSRILLKNF